MRKFLVFVVFPMLIVVAPVLLFGKIFLSGDTLHFSYPSAEFFQSHFLSGLNQNLYLGFPWASSFHYAYFNPVYLFVFTFFDFLLGYNLILLLDILLGGIFIYLFARNFSLNKDGAIVASLTYLFSQFSVFWFSSLPITNGLFLLPALALIVCKITSGKFWYAFALPLVLGYAFLSVHYQFIVMAFVGATVMLAYFLWDRYDRSEPLIKNFTPLFLYIGGLFGGLLLGAPQILNTVGFFKHITRSDFINFDYLKILDLGKYFLPNLNVFKLTGQEFFPYIGVTSLLLVLTAIFFQIHKDKKVLFCTVSFLLFFSLMIKYSPTALLMQHIPVFEYFSQPVRWLYVANLFLALLSGFGFQLLVGSSTDSLLIKTILKYYKKVLIFCGLLFVFGNLIIYFLKDYFILYAQNYFDSHLFAQTSQLPIDYYHNLITVLVNGVLYNFSFTNPNVILLFIVLLVVYMCIRFFKGKRFLGNALILIIIFNLIASFFINTKFTDKSLILDKPRLTEFILNREKDINSFRVFSYAISDAQYKEIAALNPNESEEIERFAIEGLVGNTNDVSLVGGLEANGDKKVQQIIYFYLNSVGNDFSAKMPILSALNAKYVVTPYPLNVVGLGLATSTTVTRFNVPLYLYENKNFLPRVYLAKKVIYLEENADEKNLSTVLNPENNFDDLTYVECNTCETFESGFSSADKVSILSYGDESIKIEVTSKAGRWLVVGNGNVLGWTAYLDGNMTTIHTANYILQGVHVPKGVHNVELFYKTEWYRSL